MNKLIKGSRVLSKEKRININCNTKGFEFVQEFFVDTGGMGQENEPALTQRQFLKAINPELYYGMLDYGQFQCFVGEYKKLKKEK